MPTPPAPLSTAGMRMLTELAHHAPILEFGSRCWLIHGTTHHGLVVPLLEQYVWRKEVDMGDVQAAMNAGLLTPGEESTPPRYDRAPAGWEWAESRTGTAVELTATGRGLAAPRTRRSAAQPFGDGLVQHLRVVGGPAAR